MKGEMMQAIRERAAKAEAAKRKRQKEGKKEFFLAEEQETAGEPEELVEKLRQQCFCNDWMRELILRRAVVYHKGKEFHVVLKTSSELGLLDMNPINRVLEEVYKRGYRDCPPGIAINLRQQYKDQPEDESIMIASKPIECGGRCFMIEIANDPTEDHTETENDGLSLRAILSREDQPWSQDTLWALLCD